MFIVYTIIFRITNIFLSRWKDGQNPNKVVVGVSDSDDYTDTILVITSTTSRHGFTALCSWGIGANR